MSSSRTSGLASEVFLAPLSAPQRSFCKPNRGSASCPHPEGLWEEAALVSRRKKKLSIFKLKQYSLSLGSPSVLIFFARGNTPSSTVKEDREGRNGWGLEIRSELGAAHLPLPSCLSPSHCCSPGASLGYLGWGTRGRGDSRLYIGRQGTRGIYVKLLIF